MTTNIDTGMTPDPVEEFERQIQELLNHPSTQPKYDLWQVVQYKFYDSKETEIKQGRICGFYFVRVGIAFLQGRGEHPGWYYHVEADAKVTAISEHDIVGTEP